MLRPNKQQRWSWAIALGLGLGSTVVPGALAVRLRDGKVHFVQPPSLVSATTTRNEASAWSATYYFTVAVPENADEPLGQLMLEQREGVDTLRYRLGETFAYEGGDRQRLIAVGEVTQDLSQRRVTVTFDPPVEPGRTVTLGLRPVRNPRYDGVYLFGVTAVPAGDNPQSQFLGYGRLHFYGGGDLYLWRGYPWY